MFTNTTKYYGLPQYVETDQPTMLGDFNGAMDKIDSVLHTNSSSISANQGALVTAEQNLADAKEAQENLETEVQEVKTETEKTQTDVTAMGVMVEQANDSAQATRNAAQAANNTMSELQTDLATQTTQINTLTTAYTDLEERVNNLTKEVVVGEKGIMVSGTTIGGSVTWSSNGTLSIQDFTDVKDKTLTPLKGYAFFQSGSATLTFTSTTTGTWSFGNSSVTINGNNITYNASVGWNSTGNANSSNELTLRIIVVFG